MTDDSLILLETPAPGVGLVRFNRPPLNVLNAALMHEVFDALDAFDRDDTVGCMVVTGSDRAFAAGADIDQMMQTDAVGMLLDDFTDWSRLSRLHKPVIAAISGHTLGGGCELALMCDILIASETAKFGQPEVRLGIMPGAGGTQRLTRAVGRSIALDVMLADRVLTAEEALTFGLVSRVFPVETYLSEAVALAAKIAAMPRVAVRLIKDAVHQVDQMTLREGLAYEKRSFYLLFATADKDEGMRAFKEKRAAAWTNR